MKPAKKGVDVGVVARDADALVAFYTDVVGLEFVESFDSRIGRIHRLRFGSSWIKIVGGHADSPVQSHDFTEPGVRYLTFEISDLDETWARIVDAGGEVVAPLATHPQTGARAGSIRDPEGNLVELLTRSS